jgi:hypothetical protein
LYEPPVLVQWPYGIQPPIILPPIVEPTIGLPAILRPGDTLLVRIRSDQQLSVARCRIRLVRFDLRLDTRILHMQRMGNPRDLWTIEALVPREVTHPLLYDVHVELAGRSLVQYNAAYVVSRPPDDLTLVQITDLEINHQDPGPTHRLARAIREINLIAPDAVVATGDLTYNGQPQQFELLMRLLRELDVPLFTQIGNADYHGDEWIYFGRFNAYHDYALDLGSVHLTALDSGTNYHPGKGPTNLITGNQGTGLTDDQITWLRNDLAHAAASSLRLVFMHFPAVSQLGNRASIHFNRERFKHLCAENRVALVLCGHTHLDGLFDQREKLYLTGRPVSTRPCYVQTTTVCSRTRMPLLPYSYRIVRIQDGKLKSFTYDANGDGKPHVMRSVPVGGLDVQFDPPNDGTARELTATITNRLNEAFDRARLVFRVPSKRRATYRVNGGELLYAVQDGSQSRVVVQTRIPIRSKQVVRLGQR